MGRRRHGNGSNSIKGNIYYNLVIRDGTKGYREYCVIPNAAHAESVLVDPLLCGGRGERDNGSGSLMRIMPFALMVAGREDYWSDDALKETVPILHDASSLTHGHPRSLIACVLYASACHELIWHSEGSTRDCLQEAVDKTFAFYDKGRGLFPWLQLADGLTILT